MCSAVLQWLVTNGQLNSCLWVQSSLHSKTPSCCAVFSATAGVWKCTAQVPHDEFDIECHRSSKNRSHTSSPDSSLVHLSHINHPSKAQFHLVHLNFSMIRVLWSLHCSLSLFFFLLGFFPPLGLSALLTVRHVFTVVEGRRSPPGCCSQPVHSNEHQPERSPGDEE